MPAVHSTVSVPAETTPALGDPRSGEIRALTGLRAIAAGWVVMVHFGAFLGPYYDQVPFLRPLLSAGWIGVELFFVLSGFLLTRGYLDEVGRRPTPRIVGSFLLNRLARVWPAWVAVTVLMAAWLAGMRTFGLNADVMTQHPAVNVWTLTQQLTMTQIWDQVTMTQASYVPTGWSISAEWLAYLAFPLLAVLLRPLRKLPPVVSVLLAHVAIAPLAYAGYKTGPLDGVQPWILRIACGFVAGMFLALALRDVRRTPRTETLGLVMSVCCTFLLVMFCYWSAWRAAPYTDHAQVAVVLFPGLICGLTLTTRGPARLLSTPTMLYGGRISYCVYLVHYLLLDVMAAVMWQDPAGRWVMTPKLALVTPFVLLLAIGLSAALYHGVEEPARRAILRRARGRAAAKAPAAAPAPERASATAPSPAPASPAAPRRPEHAAVRPAVPVERHAEVSTAVMRQFPAVAPVPAQRPDRVHHADHAGSR